MRTAAQKTRKNLALKIAILERDITQREVARISGIPEVRLSNFVCGRQEATGDERKVLARVLHKSESALFVEAAS